MFTLNTSIVKGTPRWSQRSYSSMYDFYMNGLIFMMEEGSLTRVVESKDDWRVALMAKITEWTQENESLFVPIIQQWDLEENSSQRVPPLAAILDASKEDIPHIYMLHSYSGQSVMYPEKLDEVNKFSPELIMAWAAKSVLEIEIESFKADLAWTAPEPEEGEERLPELTDEIKASIQESIDEHEEALKKAQAEFEEEQKKVNDQNEFAANLNDHFEVSESHMTRIEQAVLEEL